MNRLILSVIMTMLIAGSAWAEPVLIAHPSVATTQLSRSDAAKIYLGKKKVWPDGQKLTAITYTSGPVHEKFVKKTIRKTPGQFATYWKRLVFTGKGQALKTVASEQKMIEAVKNTAGALGYVDSATASRDLTCIAVK